MRMTRMDKKVETPPVHPAADAYRMMTDDELGELAESIEANGLRDPITVGIVRKERWIIDGRNRLKACELTGVAPEYEEVDFPNDDALRAFVADRNTRRNINAGQRAMAAAIIYPEPAAGGRGKVGGAKQAKKVGEFSRELLRQARTILVYSPRLAYSVRDGSMTISEAFAKAQIEKKQIDSAEARLERLREKAADLASLVDEIKMTLAEAEAALQAREREQREEVERDKQRYLRLIADTANLIWWNAETVSGIKKLMKEDAAFAGLLKQSASAKAEPGSLRKMTDGAPVFLAFLKEELGNG